jgi:hypothetical protein
MKIKELEKALLGSVAERVGAFGFDKKVKGQSFYKQTSFGRLAFHLSFIKHEADFDVTANVAVRFDELEDLINEDNELLSEAMKKNTFSLGAELGNISGVGQKRWTVASPADVESVSRSIMDAFARIGVPYLEKYSNMETALDALSGDDQAAWLHSPLHDARAVRAIGLAFLLGDRERFAQIADAKMAFLVARYPLGLQPFLRLRDTLERRFNTHVENTKEGHPIIGSYVRDS